MPQIGHQIAQLRRALVVLGRRGFLHLLPQLLLHLRALAGKEVTRRRHLHQILLARHVADARRGAVFQVRIKAMLVIAVGRCQWPAPAQVILASHQGQRAAQRARVRERPEVARAVVLLQAREREPRDRVVQVHLQHHELLVIAEADVVARVEFLDELAFQQQRLRLAPHDVEIEIEDGLDQGLELQVPAQPPGGLEILADALAQIPRLTHIDHRPEAVTHQVNARLVR